MMNEIYSIPSFCKQSHHLIPRRLQSITLRSFDTCLLHVADMEQQALFYSSPKGRWLKNHLGYQKGVRLLVVGYSLQLKSKGEVSWLWRFVTSSSGRFARIGLLKFVFFISLYPFSNDCNHHRTYSVTFTLHSSIFIF